MKCHDCGAEDFPARNSRVDVCDDCWDLRLKLIQGVKAGTVTREQFKCVQRTMAQDVFRHGRAARRMRKVLGLPPKAETAV